jgi:hypothetical protein
MSQNINSYHGRLTKAASAALVIAIAVSVLYVAPAGARLFLALIALPLETLILTSLLQSPAERSPQL